MVAVRMATVVRGMERIVTTLHGTVRLVTALRTVQHRSVLHGPQPKRGQNAPHIRVHDVILFPEIADVAVVLKTFKLWPDAATRATSTACFVAAARFSCLCVTAFNLCNAWMLCSV